MTKIENRRRLDRLRIGQGVGPGDSLRAALAGVLAAWGRDVDDAVLSVALGDAFMLTHAAAAERSSQWNIYGRHAFLAEAARDLGVSLYDLHPPDAAPLPTPPPEFATHFRDSYAPFVAAAIERDEPCLAWMGWPPPTEDAWGVVTGMLEGGRCVGRTMYGGEEAVEMIGPPVLVYVVEEVRPSVLDVRNLVGRVLTRAAAVLNNRLDASYRVTSGVASLEAWRTAAQADAQGGGSAAGQMHAAIARQCVAGRKTAARFFMEQRGMVAEREAAAMQVCCEAFREMIERLTPFAHPSGCVSAASPAFLAGLCKAIEGVLPFEQQAAVALAGWLEA